MLPIFLNVPLKARVKTLPHKSNDLAGGPRPNIRATPALWAQIGPKHDRLARGHYFPRTAFDNAPIRAAAFSSAFRVRLA